MSGPYPSTEGNAVPDTDGTDLGDCLEDLAGVHPGINLIRDGIQLLARERHTPDQTQTLIAALAGGADATNVVALIGYLVERLADPNTNPNLRHLPLDQQKAIQHAGEIARYQLTDPDLHQHASKVCAAIDPH